MKARREEGQGEAQHQQNRENKEGFLLTFPNQCVHLGIPRETEPTGADKANHHEELILTTKEADKSQG